MGIIEQFRTRRRVREQAQTDDELMQAVQTGSTDAYLAIYDRYEGPVFAYCRRVIGDPDRAADVFQESFVRVWERRDAYRGGNFEAWLFTIVRNLCRDDHHHRARHDQLDQLAEQRAAEETIDVWERAALANALAQLPDDLRDAIVLREYEGFSYQEIAELTGQSLSSVGVRIYRAKQQLRVLLAPMLENDR